MNITTIVTNVGILITCIVGFVTIFDWSKGFNSVVCSILMLPNDIDKGQDIPSLKRWRGINGTAQILDETVNMFNNIVVNKATAFGDNAWINTDPEALFKAIDDEYPLYTSRNVDSPNPQYKTTKIIPTYLLKHGPATKKGQYLSNIKQEFNDTITPLIEIIKASEEVVDNIESNIGDIISSFSSAKDSILMFSDIIQAFEANFIDFILSMKNLIQVVFQVTFIVVFIVMLIANLSGIILPLVIIYSNKPIKCYYGFVQGFYLFISIFFFILGGLIGSIGIVSNDIISVMQFIFSEDNLNSDSPVLIGGGGGALDYITVCINGNGEMENVINTPSFRDASIDDFYQLYFILLQRKKALRTYSETIVTFRDSLEKSITNFALTTTKEDHGKDDVSSVLLELTRYTYAGDYQEVCILSTKDYWTLEKSQCPRSYLYHPPSYPNSFLADSCLIVSEWTSISVTTLYASACNLIGGNYPTASLASSDYLLQLNLYKTNNKALINTILTSNARIENQYNDICKKTEKSVQNLEDLLSPFSLYYQEIVGDDKIMSFLNCKVIGEDLQVLYEQLGGQLSYYSKSLGLCCIFISFLNIGTSILMILIQSQEKYYNENPNEKTQAEIESPSGRNIKGEDSKKDKNSIQTETIPIASQNKQDSNNINDQIESKRSPNLPRANTYLTIQDKKEN